MDGNPFLYALAAISGVGVYTAALALGIRHGIDWDHIAAITDITSATATVEDSKEAWLLAEPGVALTDEKHHQSHGPHDGHTHAPGEGAHVHGSGEDIPPSGGNVAAVARQSTSSMLWLNRAEQRTALVQGTLYALGHGLVVTILGVLAILASEFLPTWIDGVMERVVGVTLIFLALYLFFSLYQYFRRGGEFRIRSRWMLLFAGVANASNWIRSRIGHHEHVHVQPSNYTSRTAFGIGVIHGIGAETGTQALIIATAVGATSKGVAIAALLFFVVGLLISNSLVTIASTTTFISARNRTTIYIGAGFVAAVFSLVVGVLFLTQSAGILPELDRYFRWIGGGTT